MNDIFEKASRAKLRFDTPYGSLDTEDLWDLPLQSERRASLDSIGMALVREIKATGDATSLVTPTTSANTEAQLKLDIVKRVIEVKQAENAALRKAADNRMKRQHILELISKKKDDELGAKSIEELTAELAALGD